MTSRNPFDEIERMFDRMSSQLEAFDVDPMGRQSIAVDVKDRGEQFVLTANLPGFEKDDIDVSIVDRSVRISAEHSEEREEEETGDGGTFLRRERRRQSVSRSVRLPEDVVEEETSASFRNGVLTVTLPKRTAIGDSESIPIE